MYPQRKVGSDPIWKCEELPALLELNRFTWALNEEEIVACGVVLSRTLSRYSLH